MTELPTVSVDDTQIGHQLHSNCIGDHNTAPCKVNMIFHSQGDTTVTFVDGEIDQNSRCEDCGPSDICANVNKDKNELDMLEELHCTKCLRDAHLSIFCSALPHLIPSKVLRHPAGWETTQLSHLQEAFQALGLEATLIALLVKWTQGMYTADPLTSLWTHSNVHPVLREIHEYDYHGMEHPEKDLRTAAQYLTTIENSQVNPDIKDIFIRIGGKIYLNIQRECRARKGETRRENLIRIQKILEARLMDDISFPTCYMSTTLPPETDHQKIILDSGASHHMFCDASLLSNIYPRRSAVYLGGSKDHKVMSEYRGSTGYLEDVIIVPTLKKNLIAASALTNSGLEITLEGPRCYVRDDAGTVISEGSVGADRLYAMDRNLLHDRSDIGYEAHLTESQKAASKMRSVQKKSRYKLTGQASSRRLATMRVGMNPLNILHNRLGQKDY